VNKLVSGGFPTGCRSRDPPSLGRVTTSPLVSAAFDATGRGSAPSSGSGRGGNAVPGGIYSPQGGYAPSVDAASLVSAAQELATSMLAEVGRRLPHSAGVAVRAGQLAGTVAERERRLLVAAAWLHDIGYAPATHVTGFHPLDGALFLAARGWPSRLCGLVAYHSGAGFAADALGLADELGRFTHEESEVSDALTYADQTTDPDGRPVTIAERMAEMLARHGSSSTQARIHAKRCPYLLAVAGRVEQRLAELASPD